MKIRRLGLIGEQSWLRAYSPKARHRFSSAKLGAIKICWASGLGGFSFIAKRKT